MPSSSAYLITALTSYMLGSIPFGYILVRLFRNTDVRTTGSGNIGATNVARTSPALGALTLVLDAVKGLAAVALASAFHPNAAVFMALAALFAIVGHMFPIWLRWRGGKGVATAFGAFLWITPRSVLLTVVLFLVVTAVCRFVSLASIVGALCFPFIFKLVAQPDRVVLGLISMACLLIVWRHHENIGRILNGNENRLSLRSS
jgi:glycerol-3-phosphate acyltransferase PlsY